jgi:hypothetical protein
MACIATTLASYAYYIHNSYLNAWMRGNFTTLYSWCDLKIDHLGSLITNKSSVLIYIFWIKYDLSQLTLDSLLGRLKIVTKACNIW